MSFSGVKKQGRWSQKPFKFKHSEIHSCKYNDYSYSPDIDECESKFTGCPHGKTCQNTIGTYECVPPDGHNTSTQASPFGHRSTRQGTRLTSSADSTTTSTHPSLATAHNPQEANSTDSIRVTTWFREAVSSAVTTDAEESNDTHPSTSGGQDTASPVLMAIAICAPVVLLIIVCCVLVPFLHRRRSKEIQPTLQQRQDKQSIPSSLSGHLDNSMYEGSAEARLSCDAPTTANPEYTTLFSVTAARRY